VLKYSSLQKITSLSKKLKEMTNRIRNREFPEDKEKFIQEAAATKQMIEYEQQ